MQPKAHLFQTIPAHQQAYDQELKNKNQALSGGSLHWINKEVQDAKLYSDWSKGP